MPKPILVLFFKSHIQAYTTRGGVFVPAHDDKRVKHVRTPSDNGTVDMFKPKELSPSERGVKFSVPSNGVAVSNTKIDKDGIETAVPAGVRTKKYYVTMIRDPGANQRVARLAGPFDTHEEALSHVDAAKKHAYEVDPKSAFDAFGTAGVESDNHKPGTLNERLGVEKSKSTETKSKPASRRVNVPGEGSHTELTMPDGSLKRIQRLNATESMGLPGWHDMVEGGEKLRTKAGRAVTVPKFGVSAANNIKKINQWLHAEALIDAKGDSWTTTLLNAINPAKMSQADKDQLTMMLFGDTQVGAHNRMAKSANPRILFLKSHVKQFTRKDGTIVKEHDDKRSKKAEAAPVARQPAQEQPPANTSPAKDAEDVRGSAHGYGTHNIEEGDTIHFKAGEFSGSGKVKAIGKDGARIEDESGREHNVHWHEVTGFKADRGDGGGKKPPENGDKPTAEGAEPEKEPQKPTVLGKQEPIPAESFNATDYAKSHDQADVSVESILAGFPEDTKEKIAAAVDRLESVEETMQKFHSDGKWTATRQELHRKILIDGVMGKDENGNDVKIPGLLSPERQKAARPQSGELPTFILLGGRGGSGKSSLKGLVYEPYRCIVLDADHIKSMLPEYEGWNASQVHEESGELFDMAVEYARIMGLNVVLDKTMKTAKTAVADVQKFKKAGYRSEAHYMHLPRQEAGKRAVKRFLDGGESGRYVPVEIVLSNTGNEAAFDQVKGMCDAWSFHDNNVPKGAKPILISQKGDPAMRRKEILRKSLEKRTIFVRRVIK